MSGAGRKHRAKHLTTQFLDCNAWTGLKQNESFAVCLEAPRSNHIHALHFEPIPIEQGRPPDASASGATHSGEKADRDDVAGRYHVCERVIHLPGKFKKVMWLSVRDVIVVRDLTVILKPSPAQLDAFYAANPEWARQLKAAVASVEALRVAPERAPTFKQLTVTTTSVLPSVVLTEVETREQAGDSGDDNSEGSADEDGGLDLVNPNRQTLHHQQHHFFCRPPEEEDTDGDEECSDEEDEDVGKGV